MTTNVVACLITFLLLLLARAVQANTEKVIFKAPPFTNTPTHPVNLDHFTGQVLWPEQATTIRTSLPVAFPTSDSPRGFEHWFLLRQLNPQQRYEVRICWAAIQPTDFWLDVLQLDNFDKIPLSLQAAFHPAHAQAADQKAANADNTSESVLALRVQAAADFYSSNQTLMQHPPAVHVDIILDPYLGNIFPTSLVPTAGYITALAIVSWYVSGIVWRYLLSIGDIAKPHTD